MNFRVAKMRVHELQLPFRCAFKHAGARRKLAHHLIVEVESNTGRVGYGEVAPRAYLSGETPASCMADLERLWWPRLQELRFGDEEPFERLRPLYETADAERKTASYAGVDVAVFDLWAREANQPLGAMLGTNSTNPARLSAVLGMGMPVALATRAFLLAGCEDFKVKVGDDASLARVATVRQLIGEARSLRLDANRAWDFQKADSMLKALAPFNIAAIEEPLSSGDPSELARLQAVSGIAVMADESLCTSSDARKLAAAGAAAFWNLRLAKVGGFSGVRALLALAKEHGVRCQLGALVGETAVLGAAARAALGLGSFAFVEAAWAGLLHRDDPFQGGPSPFSTKVGMQTSRSGHGVEAKSLAKNRIRLLQLT